MDRQAHHGQPNAPSRRRANKSKNHSQQDPASPESGLKATDNLPSTFAKARAFRKRRPKLTESSKTQPDNHRPAPSDSNPNPTDGQITIHSTTRNLGASQNESERLNNAESSKSPACLILRIQGPSIPSSEALHQRQSGREKDKEASGSYRTRAPFDWRPKKFHSRAPASTHLSHQPHTPQKRSKLSQVINADTAQISLHSQGNTNMGANFKGRNQRQLRGGSAHLNSDSRYRARPRTIQQIPRQNANGTPNRPAAVENHTPPDDVGCQIKGPPGVQKAANKAPSQEALDELKRLQEEIVLQAHLNRYKDHEDDTANPESLAKCRDGPGTDSKSDVYKIIARCRLAANPNATSSNPSSIPEDKFEGDVNDRYFVDEIRSRVQKFYAAKLDAQRESYHNSVSVYPAIVDGQIFLSRYPSVEHERLQKTPSNAERQTGNQDDSHKPEHCSKVKWEDRWEMRPRACSTYEGFRDWFRHWLEMETGDSSNIDIHHQAFFDGTAHMDGIKSLYVLDLGDVPTRLDMTSEATRLHHHETAEGYCHNLALHMKAAEEEARTRRKQARDAFIEGLKVCSPKDPNSPRANVYLRGVEDSDIPGLLMILNWYGQKSNLSSSLGTLDEQDVRQRIEDSRRAKLPFIVAAERRRGPSVHDTPEKILGYALARDSLGLQTTGRYTAELEIFIKPDHKRRGIGKCLLDKLIEVCDATYVPKRGFFYDAGCDDKTGLYPGGSRTLKRLVFTISYSVPERSQIKWLIDWLERDYHFEQQGVLKGARVKFERFLDVSYLTRNAGYDDGDAFHA
ncbi:GNAT family N-acetyltransferase [Aspergillus fischeri NRRL 181]|uniref:N-acetyltransferase domain-containing protein n=1 Tax=Neosartorya fischeri (strain ATCC 1020 / DSM 3700 / CBS 544.65 / FGSC A1164 / JCM 1740 / NRRL 181 / WB 181) TaxID=331117 RepID=A1D1R9_NEOFI|nr:conserved hypothetical protein [Aspergillus fischeri NRRL 181]EAW22362.1 conserved hypothetical protein [Aspergillus fischeri NRRL 181]